MAKTKTTAYFKNKAVLVHGELYDYSEVEEMIFKDCINIGRRTTNRGCARFDFYLPRQSMCVEYDGSQHFKPAKCFGGIKSFEATKENDRIKDKYCLDHGLTMFRISYTNFDNIESMLSNKIFLEPTPDPNCDMFSSTIDQGVLV